ncbi:hypothetical protein [Coleofasciculus sp. C1-SOL-03]|uniref:hypothetical protein n=1 Tax=Coleofasciculus sp. C1-SOL-03 TaxID=3069522 RepID=UPI00406343CD
MDKKAIGANGFGAIALVWPYQDANTRENDAGTNSDRELADINPMVSQVFDPIRRYPSLSCS